MMSEQTLFELFRLISSIMSKFEFKAIIFMVFLSLWVASISHYKWIKITFFTLSFLLIVPDVICGAYFLFMILLSYGIDLS